jgi:hypothetical protein
MPDPKQTLKDELERERPTLSDTATAVLDVLEECSGELRAVRRRLAGRQNPDGGAPDRELTDEEARQTRDAARHVAGRLEACAGALQDASVPRER